MNEMYNPYGLSLLARYICAGMVVLLGLYFALRMMKKDHQKMLKNWHERAARYEENRKKKRRVGSLLSRPVDEILTELGMFFEGVFLELQLKVLMCSYWGRVLILVGFTAFYAFLLIYFKMDRSSMERERKAAWNEIQQAFQNKIGNH